jgi:hypothetical protein
MAPKSVPKPVCASAIEPEYIDTGTLCRSPSPRPGIESKSLPISPEVIRKVLFPKLGTCDFYKVLSALTPGDKERGYYWNYGYKYCRKFRSSSLVVDPKAARWVDCVTINLQRQILSKCIHHGTDLEKIKRCAYATHASVYADCGICELDKSMIKQLRVLFVPDFDDLWTKDGLVQVKITLRNCFFRPYLFEALIDRYTSWYDLKEDQLGQDLAELALADPVNNYKVILGIMEMLSNTLDDDEVAEEFMKALTNQELQTLSKTSDGRRILFMMKSAMQSGYTTDAEKKHIERIGSLSDR